MGSSAGAAISGVLADMVGASSEGMAADRQSQALLDAIDTILHGRRSAIYVSTPITTGPELVRWWIANSDRIGSDRKAYEREISIVVDKNIAAVRPLIDRVEAKFNAPVIDPTRLGAVPGWAQPDYHRFWVEVIDRFASTVVFAEGWSFSSGCCLEFAAASRRQLRLLDDHLDRMSLATGYRSIELAMVELRSAGLNVSAQEMALASSERADDDLGFGC